MRGRQMQSDERRLYEHGCALLAVGEHEEGLRYLRTAHQRMPDNAQIRSAYGLATALAERRFDSALELCKSALKQEFFNPDLYLNAARVHALFGFKAEAIRYLRRGRMIDPSHAAIDGALLDLGVRRGPVLGFLPRRHALNRWLGAARHRIGRRASGAAA